MPGHRGGTKGSNDNGFVTVGVRSEDFAWCAVIALVGYLWSLATFTKRA